MSEQNFSLINMDGLAKPAEILVQKVCDAIGILYEPTRIKKKAKVEAEGNKILAAANIEIGEMEERAIQRLIVRETKKQENIEAITYKAAQGLSETADPSKIDDDWMVNFFNKCGAVSNEEMQTLWGKLLAGEANMKDSFSKRTVELVSLLDKSEADCFSNLCCFVFSNDIDHYSGIDGYFPIILNSDDAIYTKYGLNFIGLQGLDDIGLISFSETSGLKLAEIPRDVQFGHFDRIVSFSIQEHSLAEIGIGKVLLTKIGQELVSIAGATEVDKFLPYIKTKYAKNGIEVSY